MTTKVDPENNETRALFDLADFTGQRLLGVDICQIAVNQTRRSNHDTRWIYN